jgi:protocatechuate 3,4-dioxygenase beta subunit/predicted small secreted protein
MKTYPLLTLLTALGLTLAACATPTGTGGDSPAPASQAAAVEEDGPAPAPTATAEMAEVATAAPAMTRPAAGATAEAPLPEPVCDGTTAPNPAGPYYTPNTPERASLLEPGIEGTRLVVSGYVLDEACRPVPGAWLDFWHADAGGEYDNRGYRLRGHQFAGADGRYRLETIVPGIYPGRTRHIHVAVQAPGGEVFVTQLYFPDQPENAADGLYLPELELRMSETEAGPAGAFDFVLPGS